MIELLERQERLTINQWKLIATANLADLLDFFDFFLIGYVLAFITKRLTENELSDFSQLWHDGCSVAIIEAQDVDRNHSSEV